MTDKRGGRVHLASGGHITAAKRHALPPSDFVFPDKEAYPVDTKKRARSALSRASGNLASAGQAKVRAKVRAKWPGIKVTN